MSNTLKSLAAVPTWLTLQVVTIFIGWISISHARSLGRFIGRCGWRWRRAERRRTCEQLRQLDPGLGHKTRQRLGKRCFEQMGETILELVSLAGKDLDHLGSPPRRGGVAIEGLEEFRRQIAELRCDGRGVILISGHIGSWELAGSIVGREYPKDSLFLARRYLDAVEQNWVNGIRCRLGDRLVFQDESLLRSLRWLHEGGILAMLTDLDIKRMKGIHIPFLGKNAHTTTAPARLALKSAARLLPFFIIRDRHGYHIELDRQIDPSLMTGSEEEQIREVTMEMNGAIERAIRRHPSQWPWMHSRWHSTPEIVERRIRVRARRSLEGEVEEA